MQNSTLFVFKSRQLTIYLTSAICYENSDIRQVLLKSLEGHVSALHTRFGMVISRVIARLARLRKGNFLCLHPHVPPRFAGDIVTLTADTTPHLRIETPTKVVFNGPFFRFTKSISKAIRMPDRARPDLPAATGGDTHGYVRTQRLVFSFLTSPLDFYTRARSDRERALIDNGTLSWSMITRMTPIRDRRHIPLIIERAIRDGQIVRISHGSARIYKAARIPEEIPEE